MKPVEAYPSQKYCELCGAVKTENGIDPRPERSGVEVIRRLAFIADNSPSLEVLLIYRIAGRTEREIAKKLGRPQSTIHDQIAKASKAIRSICS